MVDTVLEIDFGISPASARGITETLELDYEAVQRRTLSGRLVNLGTDTFRKYRVTLEGGDLLPPALAGVWKGMILTMNCITELCYEVGGTPERAVVPGSSRVFEGFVYYRPQLTVMVDTHQQRRAEWQGNVQWSITLREV